MWFAVFAFLRFAEKCVKDITAKEREIMLCIKVYAECHRALRQGYSELIVNINNFVVLKEAQKALDKKDGTVWKRRLSIYQQIWRWQGLLSV